MVSADTNIYALSCGIILREDIFTCIDDDFFSAVKLIGGETLCKILQIQMINSANKLLNTINVFSFMQIDSEEINVIKAESCIKSKNGQFIIKPGIETGLSILIKMLRQKLNEENELKSRQDDRAHQDSDMNIFINKYPLLKSLIDWYKQSDVENDDRYVFLTSFIDNITCNRKRYSNNWKFSQSIKNFATCLYIMGGRQCYEFMRLNLVGGLPSLKTIDELIKNSNTALSEAEFKFELLDQMRSNFVFCSEDSTGVVRKVEYDSPTNSFIGFSTPLCDGIPTMRSYTFDSFEQFKAIHSSTETAGLLNVHMIQSLSTEINSTSFPCPLLLSAYSTTNTFTNIDVLRRWMYIFENCMNKNVRVVGFSTGSLC